MIGNFGKIISTAINTGILNISGGGEVQVNFNKIECLTTFAVGVTVDSTNMNITGQLINLPNNDLGTIGIIFDNMNNNNVVININKIFATGSGITFGATNQTDLDFECRFGIIEIDGSGVTGGPVQALAITNDSITSTGYKISFWGDRIVTTGANTSRFIRDFSSAELLVVLSEARTNGTICVQIGDGVNNASSDKSFTGRYYSPSGGVASNGMITVLPVSTAEILLYRASLIALTSPTASLVGNGTTVAQYQGESTGRTGAAMIGSSVGTFSFLAGYK